MRRWWQWALWVGLGLVVSWVVSCAPGTPQGDGGGDRTEVEFWTMQLQPKFNDYFNQLIADFEAEHPGTTVRWVDVPWAAMESKILTAVSAGTAPDVVNLNPNFAAQLAGRGVWLNLDQQLTESDRALYLPKIWQANTLEGQTFALPWYLTTRIAIYNQDLLDAAGITTPPTTYAELAAAAKTIHTATGKYGFFTTVVPTDSAEVLESMVQMGVTLLDDAGQAAFDSPAGRAAFQYWVDLYQADALPKEVLTQGHRRAIDLYQSGQTAILASSPEFLDTIATNAPTVAAASAAAPQISGDTGKKTVAVMNLAIPKSTDVPDLALDFARFVTNDRNQLAFAKAASVLPSTQSALKALTAELENAATASTEGDLTTPAAVLRARQVAAKQLPEAEVLLPPVADIKVLQQTIYDHLQAAMLGEKDANTAIRDAAQAWNARSRT